MTLSGNAGPQMKAFAEDVDGQGNSLNVFARNIFDHAVSHGVAVFFPDYTRTIARKDGKPKTLADDKAEGARAVLDAYTRMQFDRRSNAVHQRVRDRRACAMVGISLRSRWLCRVLHPASSRRRDQGWRPSLLGDLAKAEQRQFRANGQW